MSTWLPTTLKCPRCATEQPVRVAEGVHITRVPRVREEVLERRFQHHPCEGCGLTIELEHPFVYVDFDRHQWLLIAPAGEVGAWSTWEDELRRGLARAFDHGSPLAHVLADHLRARVVFGTESLREKLVVWDAGIEDAIIECLKVRLLAQLPELAASGSRIVVDRVAPDGTLHMRWFARATDPDPRRVLEISATWLDEADRDRAKLRERFADLWTTRGFVGLERFWSGTV